MIIFILCIQKVRQRGHLICPRTAGKQQGQGWNQAGCPFHRLPLRGFPANLTGWLTYTIYFLDQISHYRELAFYTWSIVILWQFQHSYLYTSINPYGSSLFIRKKKKWKQCWKEKSSQKEQANRVMSPSLALADCELLMDLNLLHLNYTVKRTKQSANHICEFCTLRHNHLWITNIQKKFQKVPKGKIWICCTSTTIYIALTLYLQLFTQNLCGISLK